MKRKYPNITSKIPPVVAIAVILICWELACVFHVVPSYMLPSPVDVVKALVGDMPTILFHAKFTLLESFYGLLIGIALAFAFATMMDRFRIMDQAFYPIMIITQTIPTIAIAPILVLWMGFGMAPKITLVVITTFFPITITVYDGFQSTKREMEELMLSFNASKMDIFMKLKLPNALPYFFSAIKMAIPISIIGAAIGEWLGAQSGLGYFSKRMLTQLDGAGVFAPIVLLSAVAMLIVAIVGIIERIAIPWRKEL